MYQRISYAIVEFDKKLVLGLWSQVTVMTSGPLVWNFLPHSFYPFTHKVNYHFWSRAANIDTCLTLMAVELWGFSSVPHPVWHVTSVYIGYLQGPMALTPVAKRLAVTLSLLVLRTNSVAAGIRASNLSHAIRTL